MYGEFYEPEEWAERVERFADPGGRSALHRASKRNPRNRSCPTCGAKNVLTPADVARGYQCDRCADRDEGLAPQW
jgi:ribosomal protein S27AE